MNATEPTSHPRPLRRMSNASAVAGFDGPAGHLRELAQAIVRRIRARPLTSLAAAVGVGFVVGGALSFRAGRVMLGAAVRNVARELLKQVL